MNLQFLIGEEKLPSTLKIFKKPFKKNKKIVIFDEEARKFFF